MQEESSVSEQPTTSGPTGEVPASAQKDPDNWTTGEEPMTGPQESYLQTLAHEAGEELPDGLSKAEASKKIDQLQSETGRGQGS